MMKVEFKKESYAKYFVYAVLILILIIAGLAIANQYFKPEAKTIDDVVVDTLNGEETDTQYAYNGYAFVKMDGLWFTQIQKGSTMFYVKLHYGPRDLENISVSGYFNSTYFNKQPEMYLTFDPEGEEFGYMTLAASELSLNVVQGIGKKVVPACTYMLNGTCDNTSIVTCDDTDKAIVYLNQTNSSAIILKGNCIEIQGSKENILKGVDKLLLTWYKIM